MSSRPDLRLDWCSYEAAKYAVEHWHYSHTMPIGKLVKFGVWEGGRYIGAVIYSTGASAQMHKVFRIGRFEVCELVRVALDRHVAAVSRIVAISIRLLRQHSSGLRLIISFADPDQQHVGTIYQAAGWEYVGTSTPGLWYEINGRRTHNRNLQGPTGFGKSMPEGQKAYSAALRRGLADGSIVRIVTAAKHKYIYPLDSEIRARLAPLAKPYPKRAPEASSDAPAIHAGEGGAAPTPALQIYHG